MEIDDSEDKIRKNLVVFCILVILVAVLGVNLDVLFSGLFKVSEEKKLFQYGDRIWECAFVVLAYLVYRFSLAKNTKTQLAEVRQEYSSQYLTALKTLHESIIIRVLKSRNNDLQTSHFGFSLNNEHLPTSVPLTINSIQNAEEHSNGLLWRSIATVKYGFYAKADYFPDTLDRSDRIEMDTANWNAEKFHLFLGNPSKFRLFPGRLESIEFFGEIKIHATFESFALLFKVPIKSVLTWKFSEVTVPFLLYIVAALIIICKFLKFI